MAEKSRVVAIILAGGMGSRFGGVVPKQLAPLAGETVISHTLRVFDHCTVVDEIVVVVNPSWLYEIEEQVRLSIRNSIPRIVNGGVSRNESLRNALMSLDDPEAKILIHDAVRPLVTIDLIRNVADSLGEARCVLPVIRSSDLLVLAVDGTAKEFLDRDKVFRGQAPQGFFLSDLRLAFSENHDGITLPLPTVYEAVQAIIPNSRIELLDGLEENIKITLPVDHMFAQRLIEQRDVIPR